MPWWRDPISLWPRARITNEKSIRAKSAVNTGSGAGFPDAPDPPFLASRQNLRAAALPASAADKSHSAAGIFGAAAAPGLAGEVFWLAGATRSRPIETSRAELLAVIVPLLSMW